MFIIYYQLCGKSDLVKLFSIMKYYEQLLYLLKELLQYQNRFKGFLSDNKCCHTVSS